jgi:phage tail sheath protein FI
VPQYETPGVYYERLDASPPAIAAIRTDIAGFAGIAPRGPLHTPVPVQSWRQFQAYFGDFSGAGYLAYAVRAFFENGGRRCWVVRVASEAAATAEVELSALPAIPLPPPAPLLWRIRANSPGTWGNALSVRLVETHRAQSMSLPALQPPELVQAGKATATVVASVAGFTRGQHVCVRQDGSAPKHKVIHDIDAVLQRIYWLPRRIEDGRPFESALSGFDLALPVRIESVEYSLLVSERGRLVRVYEGLSLLPWNRAFGPLRLPPITIPDERTAAAQGIAAAPEPIEIVDLRQARKLPAADPEWLWPLDLSSRQSWELKGGAGGLSLLSAADFTGEEPSPFDSDEVVRRKRRGLSALATIEEVAMLAVPDIHIQPIVPPQRAPLPPCPPDPCRVPPLPPPVPTPPAPVEDLPPRFNETAIYQVQAAMIQQCEQRRDRVALLDPPYSTAQAGSRAALEWRSRFDSSYAAFYFPWLRVVDPLRTPASLTREIPPSGHVAGQFARTDLEIGVHKAPANAPLIWVQDVVVPIDDAVHGLLNSSAINAIRSVPGRGIRIAGARTLSSDADWRYVNVRRLLLMIEKAIDLATQWAVFEPNDHFTRAKVSLSLTSFLIALWQRGALMGNTVAAAFFVKCDEANNGPDARANGRLLAEIGVAPSVPYEFVVVRVERTANALEIAEAFQANFR